MRIARCAIVAGALLAAVVSDPALASSKHAPKGPRGPVSVTGFGLGALIPDGNLDDFNDPGYFLQVRSIYVDKVFGGRAAAYYGDTGGSRGADGGRVVGFDFDALLKFGSPRTFGYVFLGAGYGKLTATHADSVSGAAVRDSNYDWCWTAGAGFSFMKRSGFYIEAGYVWYQTDPGSNFIPVVVGYQF